jgi:tetratricopeptide (TPR) repeat protein
MVRPRFIVALGVIVFGVVLCARAAGPLDDAYRLMAHGEAEQAIAALEKVLAEAGEQDTALRAEVTFLLGRAHESLGNWDAALRNYRIVTMLFTDSEVFANACLSLAQLQVRLRQPEKAARSLEAAISRPLSPEHAFRANLYLAEVLSVPGTTVEDLERALELFRALDEKARDPADVARLQYGLGFCYQRKNDWKHAEEHYVAAARTAPRSLWAAYALMQRIHYYRQRQQEVEAARIEKQLQQQAALANLVQGEPRAPVVEPDEQKDAEASTKQSIELELPQNAVFSYGDYQIAADRFSLSSPERTLIGEGNVLLRFEDKTAWMRIRAASVRIDLKRLDTVFSGSVSLEAALKAGDQKPYRVFNLKELVLDLDSARFRLRAPQPTH